jgi:hypothetical protein
MDDDDSFVYINRNNLYDEPEAVSKKNVQKPQTKKVGTRIINVDLATQEVVNPSEKKLKFYQNEYNNFLLKIFRERFSVSARSDGSVVAFMEFTDEEKKNHTNLEDLIFAIPTNCTNPKRYYPKRGDDLKDIVNPKLYDFLRMVSGAANTATQNQVITQHNRRNEMPSHMQSSTQQSTQVSVTAPPIEDDGFFDSRALDNDEWDDDVKIGEAEPAKKKTKYATIDAQRSVVEDAMLVTSLLHNEGDQGYDTVAIDIEDVDRQPWPKSTIHFSGNKEIEHVWEMDTVEVLKNVPKLTDYAIPSSDVFDNSLIAASLSYTISMANTMLLDRELLTQRDLLYPLTDTGESFNLESLLVVTLPDKDDEGKETNVKWFRDIIRYFLIRHLSLVDQIPHRNTPITYWFYGYEPNDVGLVALNILGLTQVPDLRPTDKNRLGALTKIISSMLTNGTRLYVSKFQKSIFNSTAPILEYPQFANLVALLDLRSKVSSGRTRDAPNGELQRIDRDISYTIRYFASQSRSIPQWLIV